MRNIICVIILSCFFVCRAESLYDGYGITPNATDLGRYGNYPVSYNTGSANVNIPLLSFSQSNHDLNLSLSYDGSGIMTNSLPGWTGHNWTLQFGGCITRIMNHVEDEFEYPSHFSSFFGVPATEYNNYFDNCGCIDSTTSYTPEAFLYGDYSADIFVFNCLGLSGRFFLGNDGQWKVDCDQNVKVIFDYNDSNNFLYPFCKNYPIGHLQPKTIKGFTLVDDNGTRYIFGSQSASAPDSNSELLEATTAIEYSIPFKGIGGGEYDDHWTASSWYLSAVVDRFDNVLYEFHYSRGYFVTECHRLTYNGQGIGDIVFPYILSLNSPVYLDSIVTMDKQTVVFDFQDAFQTDITAYRSMYNFTNGSLTELFSASGYLFPHRTGSNDRYYYLQNSGFDDFHYPYTSTSERRVHEAGFLDFDDPLQATGLKYLDNISVYDSKNCLRYGIQFSYSNIGPRMHLAKIGFHLPDGQEERNYSLTYNTWEEINKEDYVSANADHWGYYKKIQNLYFSDALTCKDVTRFYGDGLLASIDYPTGGRTCFEFEQNRYDSYRDEDRTHMVMCQEAYTGGVRIKKISNYEDGTCAKLLSATTYTYTGGELSAKPKYRWHFSVQSGREIYNFDEFKSESVVPLKNAFGPHVSYSEVTESNLDGSYSVFRFSNFSNTQHDVLNRSTLYCQEVTPYDRYSEKSFYRNKLLSQTIHDASGTICRRISNEYRVMTDSIEDANSIISINSSWLNIYRWKNSWYRFFSSGSITSGMSVSIACAVSSAYKVYYPKYDLHRVTETEYYGGDSLVAVTEYDHADFNIEEGKAIVRKCTRKATKRIADGVAGDEFCERYSYPVNAIEHIREFYFPNSLKETYLNENRTERIQTEYSTAPFPGRQHIVPYAETKYGAASSLSGEIPEGERTVIYNDYDFHGNITRFTQTGMKPVLLSWSQSGKLLQKSMGEQAEKFTYCADGNLQSATMPNGYSIRYNYDCFGRLTKKIGADGPLSSYEYNYDTNSVKEITFLDYGGQDSLFAITFFDGLGRPHQTLLGGSNTTGHPLHTKTDYDFLGREAVVWSPVVGTDSQMHLPEETFRDLSVSTYDGDTCAYSRIVYDGLGRELSRTAPGTEWQSRARYSCYRTNHASEVKHYSANDLSGTTYYKKNTLLCVESHDEDSKTSRIFTDFIGRKILEQRGSGILVAETYYVYDDFGRLAYVLQPEYQDDPDLQKYAFTYTYDSQNRISSKVFPGCEPVQYWYNYAGQMVCMQDGTLRAANKYRFFLYDQWGRQCIQGTTDRCYHPKQFFAIRFTDNGPVIQNTGYVYEGNASEFDRENCEIELVNYYDNYDFLEKIPELTFPIKTYLQGRNDSLAIAQLTGTWQRASNGTAIISVNEYDDHGRIYKRTGLGLSERITIDTIVYNYWGGRAEMKSSVLAGNGHGGYAEILASESTNKYEIPHTKLLTSSLLVMKREENGVMKIDTTVIQQPTYDEFGHVVANDRSGTAADMQYAYDNLHGWVTQIQSAGGFEQNLYRETGGAHPCFNGNISAMTWQCGTSDPLRRYDYAYDGMNRLTEATYNELLNASFTEECPEYRNNNFWDDEEDNTIDIIPRPDNPVFRNRYGEAMTYDRNSNITTMQRYGMRNDRSYGLIDDLSVSYYGNQRRSIDDAVTEALTYAGASDFVDKQNRGAEYAYNANGALTKDLNRGITNIEYDLLGNPKKITMTGDRSIEYIYSADGRRLRTIHSKPKLKDGPIIGVGPALGMNNSISKSGISTDPNALRPVTLAMDKDSTDYCGSLILRNAHPSQYLFSGGYASFDADTLSGWHYYVQDYMGNNRMVVNAQTDEIEQETHYYPYGGVIGDISTNESLQPYKFEGKVLAAIEKIDNLRREDEPLGEGQDRTFGLDWYDIQARQYDAIGVPGWNAVDPLAEKYYGISPYSMCAGNPVNFGDYDGETYYDVADNGKVVKREDEHVNDDMDVLFAKNDRSIKIEDKSILNSLSKEEQATSTSVELLSLFFFVASNTSVEWRVSGWENGDFALKTDQKISESSMPINNENSSPKWIDMHSHPGFDDSDAGTKGGSNPDMATFNCAETIRKEKNQNMYLAFVYHTRTDMTYRYNSGGSTMYWNANVFMKNISILKQMYYKGK